MRKLRIPISMIIIVVILGPLPVAMAIPDPVSRDEMHIDLEAGYRFERDAWIADAYDNALVLIGNEDNNVMKVAVVSRVSNGQYQVAACSDKILSYDDYNNGSVQLLDFWKDGHPYYSCEIKDITSSHIIKTIYIDVEQDVSGCWNVVKGYIQDYQGDLQYTFFSTENPNEIAVRRNISPEIYWPIEGTLSLDHFDLASMEETCIEALEYLTVFYTTHESGDQDETYTIVWPEDSAFQ